MIWDSFESQYVGKLKARQFASRRVVPYYENPRSIFERGLWYDFELKLVGFFGFLRYSPKLRYRISVHRGQCIFPKFLSQFQVHSELLRVGNMTSV